MKQQTKHSIAPQKPFFSTQKHCKTSAKITKPINKQKHELKQSLPLKLQSLNLPKSVVGK